MVKTICRSITIDFCSIICMFLLKYYFHIHSLAQSSNMDLPLVSFMKYVK